MQEVGSIDGVERTLKTRLEGQEEPTVSLHCDKTVAVDEVVKVMNVAKDNNYKLTSQPPRDKPVKRIHHAILRSER